MATGVVFAPQSSGPVGLRPQPRYNEGGAVAPRTDAYESAAARDAALDPRTWRQAAGAPVFARNPVMVPAQLPVNRPAPVPTTAPAPAQARVTSPAPVPATSAAPAQARVTAPAPVPATSAAPAQTPVSTPAPAGAGDPGIAAARAEADRQLREAEAAFEAQTQREAAGNKAIQAQQKVIQEARQRLGTQAFERDLAAWLSQDRAMEELAATMSTHRLLNGVVKKDLELIDSYSQELRQLAGELQQFGLDPKVRNAKQGRYNFLSARLRTLLRDRDLSAADLPSETEIAAFQKKNPKGQLPANASQREKVLAFFALHRQRNAYSQLGGRPEAGKYQAELDRIEAEANANIDASRQQIAEKHGPKLAEAREQVQQIHSLIDRLERGEKLTQAEVELLHKHNGGIKNVGDRLVAGARLAPQAARLSSADLGALSALSELNQAVRERQPNALDRLDPVMNQVSAALRDAEQSGRKEEAARLRAVFGEVIRAATGVWAYRLDLETGKLQWQPEVRGLVEQALRLNGDNAKLLSDFLNSGHKVRNLAQLTEVVGYGAELGDGLQLLKGVRFGYSDEKMDSLLRGATVTKKRAGQEALAGVVGSHKGIYKQDQLLRALNVAAEVSGSGFAEAAKNSKSPEELDRALSHLAWAKLSHLAATGQPLTHPEQLDSLLDLALLQRDAGDFLANPQGGASLYDRFTPEQRAGLARRIRSQGNSEARNLLLARELGAATVKPENREQVLQQARGLRMAAGSGAVGRLAALRGACLEARLLADKYASFHSQDMTRLSAAMAELSACKQFLAGADQLIALDDPRFRGAEAQIREARETLQRPLLVIGSQIDLQKAQQQDANDKAQLREALKLKEGMSPGLMRKVVRLAAGKPSASFSLELCVRAGVEVKLPFVQFEAALEVGLGAQIEMNESGQYIVTVGGRLGGVAAAESGAVKSKVEGGAGGFVKVSYVFASDDEAARFLYNLVNPGANDVPCTPPRTVHRKGAYVYADGLFNGVSVKYRKEWEDQDTVAPVAWQGGKGERLRPHIETQMFAGSSQITEKGPEWGLEVLATDTSGSNNPAENGTTLRLAVAVNDICRCS